MRPDIMTWQPDNIILPCTAQYEQYESHDSHFVASNNYFRIEVAYFEKLLTA